MLASGSDLNVEQTVTNKGLLNSAGSITIFISDEGTKVSVLLA
jgi:hypothetical protein